MFHIWYENLSGIFSQHKHVCGTLCHALFSDNDLEITASVACNAPS